MRRGVIVTGLTALALAAPAAAGLPKTGALVPGRSLGGVLVGESPQAVVGALGRFYGTCEGCSHKTWYFTYRPFDRHGLAVEFEHGRVSGIYTLSQPAGWHAPHGLRFGASPLAVHQAVGTLRTIGCHDYNALVRDSTRARTAYYLFAGKLWGFGLFRRGASPCR
jgi:hypothetical protein